jgi:hypothetical protein
MRISVPEIRRGGGASGILSNRPQSHTYASEDTQRGLSICHWAVVIAMISLSGCREEGLQRAVVSGTVTFKGMPVADGQIMFTPAANSQVPPAGSAIVDGHYTVKSRGGVPVGSYRVNIEAFHFVPYTLRPGEDAPRNYFEGKVREQYLPAKYNAKSELEFNVAQDSDAIVKNFELVE